jgi:hypothetical protein
MSVAPETQFESQTRVEFPNFKSSTSFNLRLLQSSTSSIFDFLNLRVLESALPMGVKCRVYFLMLATDNGLKIFFIVLLEVILHRSS